MLVDPVGYTRPYDHNLATGLARRGHAVELVTARFPHGEPPRPEGYRVHELFFTASARLLRGRPRSRLRVLVKGLEYGPNLRRLRRAIRAVDPDVLHVQWLGLPQLDVRWLRSVARERSVVFTAHDVLPRRTEDKRELWLRIFRAVDRVVVHGEGAVEQLVELGLDRGRIVRIPHPVFDAPAGAEISPPRGRTLLFFGLIRRSKGLDLLLEALPSVPGARLVVAGDPLEPVEALPSESVDWRLGYVPDADIPALLREATVVVLPYRKIESSGVLATALGHGRPVVVTDVGSLGDTVREYGAGLVVPPEDPAALAEACTRLLTDEHALAAAFAGTARARAELTWDASSEAHEELYDEVVAREGKMPRAEVRC
jgi:glycosyltransferase involved in cell wall biosynthesis